MPVSGPSVPPLPQTVYGVRFPHQAIVDAALARDAEACRAALAAHLARNILPDAQSAA